MSESVQLADVVNALAKLTAKRKEREAIVNEMKANEDKLKGYILTMMQAQGMKTANFPGAGRIEVSSRDYAEIINPDAMAAFISNKIYEASQAGRPLSEGLGLFQQRAALGNTQDYLAMGYSEEQLGVAIRGKDTVKLVAEQ